MKKELKSDKSADCRPTVGRVNVIAVLVTSGTKTQSSLSMVPLAAEYCSFLWPPLAIIQMAPMVNELHHE